MNLYEKILALYPVLENKFLPKVGIVLQNDLDGKGDYIAKWEHSTLTKPTDDQLK